MPKPAASAEPVDTPIDVGQFIENDAHAIPVAGLLASDSSLREAELTRAEWQQRLDDYLASPRP
jgi:hypothetical protein